jgi:hypothetical protein
VEERVLRIVWREALGKLEANLGDFRDQHPGEPDFATGCFTTWAKGIADDCAFRCLIAALKRGEEWAWQTLREVHVRPHIYKVPLDDVEDVVQEVLVRFKKAMEKYDPDYPGAKPSVVP